MSTDFTRRVQQLGARLAFPFANRAAIEPRRQHPDPDRDRLAHDPKTAEPRFWYLHGR